MGRVALFGDNSIEYVNILIDIWNNGDCAVLIDSRIPFFSATRLMKEANVNICYIDEKIWKNNCENDGEIKFILFNKELPSISYLPNNLYSKFHSNYSHNEAVVIYSSGTTGSSKGIILSHYAINTNADAIINYMLPDEKDCIYIIKSITHSSTLTGELLVALKTHTPLLIGPTVVLPRIILNNILTYNVTILCLNPTLLAILTREYSNYYEKINSLRVIYVSGSILKESIYNMAIEIFKKIPIYNVYGLSEAGPRVTAQRKGCCHKNSVGKPISGVELLIKSEDNISTQSNGKGVIYVKTPSLFTGYISGVRQLKSSFDGWLNTGDIGYVDESGELYIIGRVDDVIIINSHKIYPSEIENCISKISSVSECVVLEIEYNDEDIIVCAYVSETAIEDDIKRKLKEILAIYEIPRLFIRCTTIPRTSNGKISRRNVKEKIERLMREN